MFDAFCNGAYIDYKLLEVVFNLYYDSRARNGQLEIREVTLGSTCCAAWLFCKRHGCDKTSWPGRQFELHDFSVCQKMLTYEEEAIYPSVLYWKFGSCTPTPFVIIIQVPKIRVSSASESIRGTRKVSPGPKREWRHVITGQKQHIV